MEDDDDDDDEEVLTSPDMKRNVPRTGPAAAAAGSTRARSPENEDGTSSGEDTQWFKQPSAESAVTVKRANAMNTTGNPGKRAGMS